MTSLKSKSTLQVPAAITDVRPRADKSVKLSFETRGLTGEEAALVFDNFQGEGWLVFKPNSQGVTPEEVPLDDAKTGAKSQSKRLRDVIYIFWQQQGGIDSQTDFETFYREQLEKLIEVVKSKLEKEE